MANKVSMSAQECESELGPRGNLRVTSDNRRTVRKWLNAQGFPSHFTGGLSLVELAMAYNDTTGGGIKKISDKLARCESEDREDGTADSRTAGQASQSDGQTAAARDVETLADVAKANETAKAETPRATAGQPGQLDQRMIAAIAAAMAAVGPGIDVEALKKDVARDVVKATAEFLEGKTLSPEQIAEIVAKEAPKHVKVTRIELKAEGSDDFQELEGHHHPQFARLLKAAAARQTDGHHPNIWIAGPAGSGKTHAAKMVAKALGLEYFYNGALSMSHELLGFIDAGGTYHETPFYQGYTRPAVYLFDEVDGSDNSALLALNAGLANGRASFPCGQAERHKDSVIIATANTWGLGATADYVGRAKIDAAFLSRFPVRIQWDYDIELEQAICGNAAWAKRVQKARDKARAAGIKVLIDPRASIGGAALLAAGFSMDEAAEMTYLANLTKEQKQMVQG